MDDIWSASTRTGGSTGLINAWWAAWLVGSTVSNVAGRLLFNAEELDSLAAAARFDVVSIALMLVAAVLAIGVVRRITDVQEQQRSLPAPVPGVPGGYPAY
ncbi:MULTISPECIES: DUF4328 domain-containing protein [unclassified Nonomuraea]|uniref:DUF4328 domain-containing protein n=1 Tax=unclassified Nonomuraea TaxID=2593643 RepID=UPI0035BFCDF8